MYSLGGDVSLALNAWIASAELLWLKEIVTMLLEQY